MANKAKKQTSKSSIAPSAGLEQAFAAAVRAVQSLPASDEAWVHLEELAERMERAGDAAAAYRDALAQPLDRDLRKRLGQRALRFHEAWFGDDPEVIHALLLPFVDGLAENEWAFERLTRVLTLAERWNPLLDTYDRALARTQDGDQRQKLLDDAAHVAKDFAGQPERAIGYLEQLQLLEPGNAQHAGALERLLERCERIADLIALWRRQLEVVSGEPARGLRLRIAATCLDRLQDPAAAVAELRALLDELPGHAGACEQLERVLALASAPKSIRLEAFALLRSHYDAARRLEQVVLVIDRAIELSDGPQRRDLHREAAQRLAILDRDRESMAHYAALLHEDGNDTDARRSLRRLAERSGLHDVHAQALVAAAESTGDAAQRASLLSQAATLQRDALGDSEAAIALFRRVLEDTELGPRDVAPAARELVQLFSPGERAADRLAILERLAQIEPSQVARRVALSEAAQLAESIGDTERALGAWRVQLKQNPSDLDALNASVRLLAQAGTAADRIEMLRRRAACELPPEQQRADLMQIAQLHIEERQDLDGGIAALLEVAERFGVDEPLIRALDAALSRAGRYSELAELIRRGISDHHPRAARWLSRLGDISRAELRMPERALGLYVQALSLDPRRDEPRKGLRELAQDETYARSALDALARTHRELGEWDALCELTRARVQSAASDVQRARILVESARVLEEELTRPDAALAALCEAFVYDPVDSAFEGELMRLGEQTGHFEQVAQAYGRAASAAMHRNDVAVRLQYVRARLLETRLGETEEALSSYLAAFDWVTEDRWGDRPIDPSPRMLLHAVTRCAAALGSWPQATDAAVHASCLLGAEESELLARLEAEASARDAWAAMCARFAAALDNHRERMSDDLSYRLEIRLALWYRHRAADLAAAEAMALRALERERSRSAGATLLCDIQRNNQSPALVGSLLRLDALDAAEAIASGKRSLDLLYEAASRTVEQDRKGAVEIMLQLYLEASRLWSRGVEAAGERSPATCVSFALEQLVKLDIEQGRVERAIQILLDAAKLPLTAEESRSHRARAAQLLSERGQLERAVAIYQALCEEAPSDLGLVLSLVALLEQLDRVPELIVALRRELKLNPDPARQLALRLRLSGLIGEIEEDDGRLKMLQANLQSELGHPDSVEALVGLMIARGRQNELALVLSQQASALQERDRIEEAAALFGRAADLYEGTIGDLPAAIGANERVVALSASPARLATLARLCLAQQLPARAAHWLGQRLPLVEGHERVAALLQLARAQLAAEQSDAAVATLEAAFAEAPKNAEVRKLLLAQHRSRVDHEALARTLSRAAEQLSDAETVVAYAREAAQIYRDRLGRQELALKVLTRALVLAPEDRGLGLMLAEARLAAGLHEDAQALLAELIAGYGARRSAERAGAHVILARVLHAKRDVDGALDQLETAQKMDGGNVDVVRILAELARDAGQLERAERAYRSLLLMVRDHGSLPPSAAPIGPGEVLMQLSWIAADLGQQDKATERCESALEALVKNEADAQRVQAGVLARADHALLQRVLETRLSAATSAQRRGEILAEYAALLAGPLGDRRAAFERWLQAIESHPAAPQYHAAALAIAREIGELPRYAALLQALRERTSTPAQSYAQCEVLLRLGELAEPEDAARAVELYRAAEATGVREVDVWRAQAACAATRGDTALQLELLTRLSNLGEQVGADTRADALYRLAEVQLAHEESVADGITSLTRALEEDPRNERAGRILERACRVDEPNPDLLGLYERVARRSNDEALLLGFLERQARRADALPEEVQEAVTLAHKRGHGELAEELMLRAVEIAQELPDGRARVQWAMMGLVDRRFEQRDLAGAVKWLLLASENARPEQVIAHAQRLASAAAEAGGDLTLAAKLYEHLLELMPTVREVWEPLAGIYASLGDIDRFERVVGNTLDSLESTADRALLRMQHAQLILEHGGDLARAAELLREILVEDPRHAGAQDLLIEIVARGGRPEDLQELLEQHLSQAQQQSNAPAVRAAALRLGEHLRGRGALDEEIDVYREALPWLATDRELIGRLLHGLGESEPEERAKLLEALLASDPPDEAAAHALAAAELHEQRGDSAALSRVLEQGRRRAPDHPQLIARIERSYRDAADHAALAQLLRERAEREQTPERRSALWLEAAVLYRDQLSQPAQAVALLGRAAELAPSDVEITSELAALHLALAMPNEAIEQLGRGLEHCPSDERRAALLRMRAGALQGLGELDLALADLERAFDLQPEAIAPELEGFLEERRRAARSAHDLARERSATERLVDVLIAQHKLTPARKALSEWIARERGDRAALQRLVDVCAIEGDTLGIAETAARLCAVTEGQAQIDACRTLTGAAIEIGRFDLARSGLESVLAQQPEQAEFRAALKDVYARTSANQELAAMLLEDAARAVQPAEMTALLKQAGECLMAASDAQQAISVLRDALALAPDDVELTFLLVDAFTEAGEIAAADGLLDGVLTNLGGRRAELSQHARRKARLAQAAGDRTTELAWLVEAGKYDKAGALTVDIANLAEALEDWDTAEKALRNLLLAKEDIGIGRCEVYVRQARIWMARGDSKRALMLARKAQKEEPESAEVIMLLEQLGAA